jgi:cytochrome c oxidase assembly factor 3
MRASPALLRTRAPYLVKNTITGLAICSLVIGICMCYDVSTCSIDSRFADSYTINAISQDEFDDVIVPDKPLERSVQQPPGTSQALQQAVDARK